MSSINNITREYLNERKVNICDHENSHEFSVLVPIVLYEGAEQLLFEVRSEKLDRQPNEICFPGGAIEENETREAAALRETSEELCIPLESIELLGELDTVVTPFSSIIYPYTGILHDYSGSFSSSEVKEIFLVPVSYFIENEPLLYFADISTSPGEDFPFELIRGGRSYPWGKGKYPTYFYVYGDKIIWGITARIVYNFISIVKNAGL